MTITVIEEEKEPEKIVEVEKVIEKEDNSDRWTTILTEISATMGEMKAEIGFLKSKILETETEAIRAKEIAEEAVEALEEVAEEVAQEPEQEESQEPVVIVEAEEIQPEILEDTTTTDRPEETTILEEEIPEIEKRKIRGWVT